MIEIEHLADQLDPVVAGEQSLLVRGDVRDQVHLVVLQRGDPRGDLRYRQIGDRLVWRRAGPVVGECLQGERLVLGECGDLVGAGGHRLVRRLVQADLLGVGLRRDPRVRVGEQVLQQRLGPLRLDSYGELVDHFELVEVREHVGVPGRVARILLVDHPVHRVGDVFCGER